MIIDYDTITKVLRDNDSLRDSLDSVLLRLGIDPEGALGAAQQRGIRAWLLSHDKRIPDTSTPVEVEVDSKEVSAFSATWLDGLVTGFQLAGGSGVIAPDSQNRRGGVT